MKNRLILIVDIIAGIILRIAYYISYLAISIFNILILPIHAVIWFVTGYNSYKFISEWDSEIKL